ncbi:MAG: prenyltransferase/squalene oxidase repeat-containing protein [Planctomycetota bacterium]
MTSRLLVVVQIAAVSGVLLSDSWSRSEAADVPGGRLRERVATSIDRGCNWLIDHQNPDGSYGRFPDVGITAFAIEALARSPRAYREQHGPAISKAVEYLLANRHPDGSIFNEGQALQNYKTSMAILALVALDSGRAEPRYAKEIEAAKRYVMGLQCSEESTPAPFDAQQNPAAYGGIGYGSSRKPDLSNTQIALDALHAVGLAEDAAVLQRARLFLTRCQNAAQNDFLDGKERVSTGDGGFIYSPDESKAGVVQNADGTTSFRSYGSMTYAGLKSYIYAGLTAEDPRVQAALGWISNHFTVDENPGMAIPEHPERGQMGLYYYYVVMARTFEALGQSSLKDKDGKEIFWANQLATKLLALQAEDGSWQNPVDRWWESDQTLVTAYAIRALTIASKYLKD